MQELYERKDDLRNPFLQKFLDILLQVIKIQSLTNPIIVNKAESILSKTRKIGFSSQVTPRVHFPALKFFDISISMAESYTDLISDLAKILDILYNKIPWYQSSKSNCAEFLKGHVNAQLLGPLGLEKRKDIVIGLSLLAPNTEYPRHQHDPEEIYIALTSGDWSLGKNDWITQERGNLVYTPPNELHSMRAREAPLLTVWCLSDSNF